MTNEEAKEWLWNHISIDVKNSRDIKKDEQCLLICKAALEKQIPKKPKIIDHWHMCPTCYDKYGFSYDILVGMMGIKTGKVYCLNCGQAIDWSKEK